MIGKDGAKAIPQAAPAPIIRGLMQNIKAYETLTVQAAVSGDREAAFQAMLLHPLMPGAPKLSRVVWKTCWRSINRTYRARSSSKRLRSHL